MKVVNYDEYVADKKAFFAKHEDCRVETSAMNEYSEYFKTYISMSDGAVFYEKMGPVYEKATIELHKVMVEVEVKFFRTEYWSSDESESKYYYENY